MTSHTTCFSDTSVSSMPSMASLLSNVPTSKTYSNSMNFNSSDINIFLPNPEILHSDDDIRRRTISNSSSMPSAKKKVLFSPEIYSNDIILRALSESSTSDDEHELMKLHRKRKYAYSTVSINIDQTKISRSKSVSRLGMHTFTNKQPFNHSIQPLKRRNK